MSQLTQKNFSGLKIQLVLAFSLFIALFFGLAVYRLDQLTFSDRLSWLENQSRLQVSNFNQSMKSFLSRQRALFVWNAQELINKKTVQWSQLEGVQLLASGRLNKQNIVVEQWAHRENSPLVSWQALQIEKAVGKVDFVEGQEIYVRPLQIQKKNYVIVLFKLQDKLVLSFSDDEAWKAHLDALKVGSAELAVWTKGGYTVAHSTAEYFAQAVDGDVVFAEAQRSDNNHGLGVFKQANGSQIFAYYEQMEGTNLYTISSVPLREVNAGRWSLILQFLFLGFGLIFICMAGVIFILKPFEKNYERLRLEIKNENMKLALGSVEAAPNSEANKAADEKIIHNEKMQAYSKVSSALAHEVSGPVSAILGFAQQVKVKAPEAAEGIQKEARHIRQVMERLLQFSGETLAAKENLPISGPVQSVVKMIEPVLSYQGIQLEMDLQSTALRSISYPALTKAIDCILRNSIESLDRCPKKKISIKSWDAEERSYLEIADTGAGIEAQDLPKIFDPFFSTKSPTKHIGLGLATALGILRDHHADIQVKSQPGQGTTLLVTFDPQASTAVSGQVLKAPMQDELKQIENDMAAVDSQKSLGPSGSKPSVKPHWTPPPPDFKASEEATRLSIELKDTMNNDNEEIDLRPEEKANHVMAEIRDEDDLPPLPTETFILKTQEEAKSAEGQIDAEIDSLLALPEVNEAEQLQDDIRTSITEMSSLMPEDPVSQPQIIPESDGVVAAATVGMKNYSFIDAPKAEANVRVKGVDSFQVEIRRPMKRP